MITAYFYKLANLVSLYTAAAIFTILRFFKVGEVYE